MTAMKNLMNLMNLPYQRLAAVVRTSDGFYLAQVDGDAGFNLFFGAPAPLHPGAGLSWTLTTWEQLSDEEKKAVVKLAAFPPNGVPIPLERDFGVPVAEFIRGSGPGDGLDPS